MFFLWQLKKKGRIPEIPVYLDSPMGINVSYVFAQFPGWHKLQSEESMENYYKNRKKLERELFLNIVILMIGQTVQIGNKGLESSLLIRKILRDNFLSCLRISKVLRIKLKIDRRLPKI